jgi:N-acetylglucosamine kinase-like BadF-type ATPase
VVNAAPEGRRIAIDLGKTNCRVRIDAPAGDPDREAPRELRGAGFPGLAAAGGVDAALAAIFPLLDGVGDDGLAEVADVGVGAAGADSDRDAALATARRLREDSRFVRPDVTVAVASDVLAAHLGAFSGGPGTVLIAGTGAVAYRLGPDGVAARADGYGPWLGDEGSGRWLGQAGLQAALRSGDGRGPATALEEDAKALGDGDLAALPRRIAAGPDAPRRLAAFAPAVLRRAREGDGIARELVADAAARLAATAAAVADPGSAVSVLGGLADDPDLLRTLLSELVRRDLMPHRPAGTSLDGAALLAARRDLPHERYAIRV